MTTEQILELEQEQVKTIADTALTRAERAKVVAAVTEHLMASAAVKDAEERKKKAAAMVSKLMTEKGEESFVIPELARVTMVRKKGAETLDKAKLIHAMIEGGIEIKIINGWLKKATSIGTGSVYPKITPAKGDAE